MMGFKSNSTKGGGGYNEIVIHDSKADERIVIHAQKDMDTTVLNNDTQHVLVDRRINVDGTHTETVKGNMTTTVTEGHQANTVQAGNQTNAVKTGSQTNTVKQKISIESQSSEIEITASTKITLHVGESSLVMDSAGNITLSGKVIKISGKTSTEISAPKNHIAGTTKMDGGDVFIN